MQHNNDEEEDDRKRPAKPWGAGFDDSERPSKRSRIEIESRPPQGDDNASWTPEMHRAFVQAIFNVGINRASPGVITQNMKAHPEDLTAERIKSHLQKFRKNRDKSVQNFMEEYESVLSHKIAASRRGPSSAGAMPQETSDGWGSETAANLTFASLMQTAQHSADQTFSLPALLIPTRRLSTAAQDLPPVFPSIDISASEVRLPYPNLSPQELHTPLGRALQHVIGLIQAMTDQLDSIRGRTKMAWPGTQPTQRNTSPREANTTNSEVDATLRQLWSELNPPGSANDQQDPDAAEEEWDSFISRALG